MEKGTGEKVGNEGVGMEEGSGEEGTGRVEREGVGGGVGGSGSKVWN